MKTSESIKAIAGAMNKAQKQMTAAKTGANNPFFKSKYADLGSVILALKEPFADNGLSYIQSPEMQDNAVGVTTRIMHESGEWLEGTLLVPLEKPTPQGAGSAITYARRYTLQSMAGIPAADDDAEFAMGRKVEPEPAPAINAEEVKQLQDALQFADYDEAVFCKSARINKLEELMASRFAAALDHIKLAGDKK